MPIRFRPPRDIPDLGLTRGQQERFNAWLRTAFTEIAEDMAALGQSDAPTIVAQETIDVAAGSMRRVTPPVGGMAVRVPAPSPANAGQTVRLMIEAPVGDLTVVAVPGVGDDGKVFQPTINGSPRATFTTSGLVTLTSNGSSDWKSASEFAAEAPASVAISSGGGALDAQYLLRAANALLPNARVADDSTEIDISYSSPGLISWFLKTASVAFSKLANLTGLSVLGRSASSSGVMAAITATAGYQALRSNPAGTSIGWESYLPTTHTATVSGTVDPLSLPALLMHGDNLSISTSTGNVTLNGIDATGVPVGFTFFLGFGVTVGDLINTSFLLQDEAAANPLNEMNLPGNQGIRALSGSRVMIRRGTASWQVEILPQMIVRDNGTLESPRSVLNFVNSTTNTAVVTADSTNNEHEVTYQRAALTGFAAASANSNATTSAEPLVAYSASANMSAERVLTTSTSETVDISVAGQIQIRSAAKTGAISQAANANATLFAGIRDNGSAETDRTNLNFLNSSTVNLTVTDDSGNDELEITADVVSLPSALVTPTMLAIFGTPTNTGVPFIIYMSYAAGAGGSADDVTVFNASAPFAFRILEAWQVTATAVALATTQLRSASGGAGSALTTAMLASVTGKSSDNSTATTTVAASGSAFLRRSDSGVGGEFIALCVRT